MDWTTRRCIPCEGGVPRMAPDRVEVALRDLEGWDAREEGTRLHKHYRFRDFAQAMRFVDAMAEVAEAEGHHPDFCVRYAAVDVTVFTHAIGGLSENDFVLAAKIDARPESRAAAVP